MLRKAANSEGQSNKASEETQNTRNSDLGEYGNPNYHQMNSCDQEDKRKKQEFRKQLNQDARKTLVGTIHQGIKLIVHRPEAILQQREEYYRLSSEIMPVIRELVRKAKPLLEHEVSVDFARHHVYGSRFHAESIASKDFRYFAKKRPPEEAPSLAVALRIDESASMSAFGRLGAAKGAAIAVYEFCDQCDIPLLIYGDTADRSKMEQMSVYAYSDFSKKEADDRFRLMHIQGRSNNRDGLALRILSEKLLTAPKQTKLLISISDGQPKATPDYTGSFAVEDVQNTIKEYSRKGITFIAAAIGQDKDIISQIYGKDRFLDITDLNHLPTQLVNMITRYL
ncbi:vWA domain-containing protein [Desulfitobacterium dehalogenans]|uniref:vWA domain-containing protein n=1 Tax=Desulfitobacterium dehalogenans TaxID=36854 RepID=UPI0002497B3B|nr:nitric oxide reductase activation protein NorD [Desulfitobacterium dehalogenans]